MARGLRRKGRWQGQWGRLPLLPPQHLTHEAISLLFPMARLTLEGDRRVGERTLSPPLVISPPLSRPSSPPSP